MGSGIELRRDLQEHPFGVSVIARIPDSKAERLK